MEVIKLIQNSKDIFNTIQDLSIEDIEIALVYSSDKYYNEEPVISDAIFDMMREFLQLKSPKSKVLKMIGANVKSKDKVKLPYYLGSMDKIKPPSNKLDAWKKEYDAPYILSDKLDGVSALLVYKIINKSNINTISMYTRGTATHGMDISKLLNYIKNIPSSDEVFKYFKKHQNIIAFRGELIISKNRFDTKWSSSMKNARNAIAGLVCSKHINPELAHDTSFVVYQIVDPIYTMLDQVKIIKELGFKTVHYKKINDMTFKKLSKYLLKRREKSKYVIDGIIVTNNMKHSINTKGNPEYAFAFKDVLEDQKAISIVIEIEWNSSKDGLLIPTIIIDPVDVGGVTITRITGNNARFIVDNKIGVGAKVEVIRSNDVIPKIEKVLKTATVLLPKGEWNESGVHLISDIDNNNVMIKNIYYFFSTIGTMGLGEAIITKLYNAGHDTILKLLKLKTSDIISIEGFKQKSAQNIVDSIKKSTTNIPLHLLMKASNKLGRGMGEERCKDVLEKIPDIMNTKYTESQLTNILKTIDGWEDITSKLFATHFKDFIEFYNSIKNFITVEIKKISIKSNKLEGQKIVMSGFRDKELSQSIVENSGIIASTVSKNTNILIVKDISDTNTSKAIKAKELGITIYTIDDFNKKYKFN